MNNLTIPSNGFLKVGDIITIEGFVEPIFNNFIGRFLLKLGINKGLKKYTVKNIDGSTGLCCIYSLEDK